jgi:hypothetical protein
MRRAAVVVVPALILGSLASLGLTAATSGTLDQSQANATTPLPDPSSVTYNGRHAWAQTFTAGKSGRLNDVQLVCTGTANASITVDLMDVNASTPPSPADELAEATGTCANPGSFNDFVFASPYSVTAGTVYGLVIPYSTSYSFAGAFGDLYTAGASFDRDINNAWYLISGFDIAFKTYVEPPDQSNLPSVVGCSDYSSSPLAQTFTAGQTGPLTGVDLWMNEDGIAAVTLSIEGTTAGKPDGTVLATASATPLGSGAWVDFSFSSPPTVTAGNMYAIVFNMPLYSHICGAGAYAGGRAWDYDAAWFSYGGDTGEFAFQTYVDAAAPTAATPSPTPSPVPTASPSPVPTSTPSPVPTASSTPVQSLRGATSAPTAATPPATSTATSRGSSSGGSAILLLFIGLVTASAYVAARRYGLTRR